MSTLLKHVSALNAAYQHPILVLVVYSSSKSITMGWSSKNLDPLVLFVLKVRRFNHPLFF